MNNELLEPTLGEGVVETEGATLEVTQTKSNKGKVIALTVLGAALTAGAIFGIRYLVKKSRAKKAAAVEANTETEAE